MDQKELQSIIVQCALEIDDPINKRQFKMEQKK